MFIKSMAENENRLKITLHKAFKVVKNSLYELEQVNKSGINTVKELHVLGESLRFCSEANVDHLKVVKTHQGIKDKLLIKLESDVEIERCNLNKFVHSLGSISNRISNENSSVYTLYEKLSDNKLIESEIATLKTETCPSLAQMIVWLSDIDKEIETAYVIRKFVTETTDFKDPKASKNFVDTWKNQNHLPPVEEILLYTQFFINSDL